MVAVGRRKQPGRDMLSGVIGEDRRGQRNPVAVTVVSPATAKRRQAETRKARFQGPVAIPEPPKRCRKKCCRKPAALPVDAKPPRRKKERVVDPPNTDVSPNLTSNGHETRLMHLKRDAQPIGEWWYIHNDLTAPEIPPLRRNPRNNTDAEPVYRSETPQ